MPNPTAAAGASIVRVIGALMLFSGVLILPDPYAWFLILGGGVLAGAATWRISQHQEAAR